MKKINPPTYIANIGMRYFSYYIKKISNIGVCCCCFFRYILNLPTQNGTVMSDADNTLVIVCFCSHQSSYHGAVAATTNSRNFETRYRLNRILSRKYDFLLRENHLNLWTESIFLKQAIYLSFTEVGVGFWSEL